MFLYGGGLWDGIDMSDVAATLLTLFVICGPGAIAAVFAHRILRRLYGNQNQQIPWRALVTLVLLALVSCYLGMFFSVNTWGV